MTNKTAEYCYDANTNIDKIERLFVQLSGTLNEFGRWNYTITYETWSLRDWFSTNVNINNLTQVQQRSNERIIQASLLG